MILTGDEIERCVADGTIEIDPFNKDNVGANSYDLTLGNVLKIYDVHNDAYRWYSLDLKKISELQTVDIEIPEKGLRLEPNELYLASTNERTRTDHHIPCIETRSSLARAGLSSHVSAGFGDIGFNGKWTLEITVVRPLIIYPNIRIAQVFFHKPYGAITRRYQGRYQGQDSAVQSRFNV